jgi:hypothetical protein
MIYDFLLYLTCNMYCVLFWLNQNEYYYNLILKTHHKTNKSMIIIQVVLLMINITSNELDYIVCVGITDQKKSINYKKKKKKKSQILLPI